MSHQTVTTFSEEQGAARVRDMTDLAKVRDEVGYIRDGDLACTLLRFEAVEAALRNRSLGAGMVTLLSAMAQGCGVDPDRSPFIDMMRAGLQNMNGEEHTRYRAVITPFFAAPEVRKLQPRAQEIAERLVAEIRPGEETDVVAHIAGRLPVSVIAEMLGVPEERHEELMRSSEDLAAGFSPAAAAELELADAAQLRLTDCFAELLTERRKRPGTDMLSALILAEVNGQRFTDKQICQLASGLIFGGHETTKNLIGSAFMLLAQHPGERERLARDRSRMDLAVQEILRYEPPTAGAARIAIEKTRVGDLDFDPGALIICSSSVANRDPRRFSAPERFDVFRDEGAHLSFGFGAYFCIGALLARLELAAILNAALDRFSRWELAPNGLNWREGSLRGPSRLCLRFFV
jgi:cytochrome P450